MLCFLTYWILLQPMPFSLTKIITMREKPTTLIGLMMELNMWFRLTDIGVMDAMFSHTICYRGYR